MLAKRRYESVQVIVPANNDRLARWPLRLRYMALCGTICLAGFSVRAYAQSSSQPMTPQEAARLRTEILKQKHELRLQAIKLNDEQNLLDVELGRLRGTGTGSTAQGPAPVPVPANTGTTQEASSESQSAPAPEAAPITGPSRKKQAARRVLQTAQELSSTGGVLTPKGDFVIDPSFEYDYYNENQVNISGFTIIPGITFGNINIQRVQKNQVTTAVTFRYGLTNRLELNVRIPFVYATGSTTLQPLGPNAQIYSPGASASSLGDIVAGASYQINSGNDGWPILISNLLFKTTTGTSPFSTPIYTTNDPNGIYIAGIPKRLPTGTGFYALEPNMTILVPASPAVLFANILYGINFSSGVEIANRAGGPATPATIGPGNNITGTFGVGFAVNNRTSMTLSYQQEHVWSSTENGARIPGSSFDFGMFNFGIGFTLNRNMHINVGAGIGVGPNSPAAKILIEIPMRFDS